MEHYFKSYARPNLFDDESDDDDACVETPLITPIHSAATIPIGRKQSGGSDSVVIGSYKVSYEEWDVPNQPTLSIMTNKVTDLNDKVTTFDAVFVKAKAIGKELKGYQIAAAEATCLAFDLNQIQRVQGELLSIIVSSCFEHGLNMDQTQDQLVAALKKILHFVPGLQGRLVKATPLVATTDYPFLNKVVDHSAHPLSAIMELGPNRLARPAVVLTYRVELLSKDTTPSSTAALEQNEEWLGAMVNTTDEEMVKATSDKPRKKVVPPSLDVLVIAPADPKDAAAAPYERISVNFAFPRYLLTFVGHVVASFTSRGLDFPNAAFLDTFLAFFGSLSGASTEGLVLIPNHTYWFRNSSKMDANHVNASSFRFRALGRYVIQNL
nr:hypothetical protein [Tanacetum cinerariifolium]